METFGLPGRVHVSAATQQILRDAFRFERCAAQAIKGKGRMETFFLTVSDPRVVDRYSQWCRSRGRVDLKDLPVGARRGSIQLALLQKIGEGSTSLATAAGAVAYPRGAFRGNSTSAVRRL